MSDDPRSWRVAVVADSLFARHLAALRGAGVGVMQLPADGLAADVAAKSLELLAEQVAEYRRSGYEVTLLDDGTWAKALEDALHRLGTEPLEPLDPESLEPQ